MNISDEDNEVSGQPEETLFSLQKNPLLIDAVLRSLFNLVNYSTLKKCRLVSKKWKDVGDSLFLRRSALAIRTKTKGISESFLESPEDIPSLFKSIISHQEVRFSSFKFDLQMLTNPIKDIYLVPNKLTILQLEINGERDWCLENRVSAINIDIDSLIGPNLIKLKLGNLLDNWIISLEKLSTIRQVDLYNCTIVINSNAKMTPEVLKLSQCTLEQKGHISIAAQMNEIIDFCVLRKLYLCNGPRYYGGSCPILNLSDCCNIKNLTLISMTVNLNAKISPEELTLQFNGYKLNGVPTYSVLLCDYLSCTYIRKMTLNDKAIALIFDTFITIDELEIKEYTSSRGVNRKIKVKTLKLKPTFYNPSHSIPEASLLPQTIEYLELANIGHNPGNIDNSLYLPNLKTLSLTRGCANLELFQNCPLLTHISLDIFGSSEFKELNVDILPPNIKGLSLKSFLGVQIVGNRIIKLDTLSISSSYGYLDKMISYFKMVVSNQIQAKLVIFHGCSKSGQREENIGKLMEMKQKLGMGTLAFGQLKWESDEIFQNSELFSLADKKAEYYLFESQVERGKGISKLEFSRLNPFN